MTFALGCTQVEDSIGRGTQTDASKKSAEAPSLQVFHKHLPEPSSNGVERAQDSSGDISSADIMRVENMAKIVRDGVGDDATVGRAGIAHEMDAGTRTQRKSLKAWQKQHAAAVTGCFWIAHKRGTLRTERSTEQRTRTKPKKMIPLKPRFLAAGSAIPGVF